MTKASELAHLFRALKAPAAARALPKLADGAREEQWSFERFAEALLSTEVASRETHGGESRIKAARFPARKTLEEFDFTFQRSVKKQVVEHLGSSASSMRARTASCSAHPAPASARRNPGRRTALACPRIFRPVLEGEGGHGESPAGPDCRPRGRLCLAWKQP
jgi:IstB-like ATP binding protein